MSTSNSESLPPGDGAEPIACPQPDQRERWQQGDRIRVEVYLERYPTLQGDIEAILNLISGEVLLRRECGETVDPLEYLRRFPQYADQLLLLFAVNPSRRKADSVAPDPQGTTAWQEGGEEVSRSTTPVAPEPSDESGRNATSAEQALSEGSPMAAPSATQSLASLPQPDPSPNPAEWPTVPGYVILEELGRGGMGIVYKARHLVLGRLVALKFINKERFPHPRAVVRFHREAQMAARLAHPHIVTVYDAGQAGDRHFLCLEYVEGTSLTGVLRQSGPLPVPVACEYVRQVAEGLQHSFERGMVHRDIKPQNLMRTPAGQIKILDFGIGRFFSDADEAEPLTGAGDERATPDCRVVTETLTETGLLVGTPDYMAPEQVQDARTADIRADIYSLGCTFYHLLAGHPPFHSTPQLGKLAAHLEQAPKPLSLLRGDVPAGVLRVIERMTAKDLERRYQTPAEVSQALAPFVNAPLVPPTSPRLRRRRRIVVASLVAAVLLMFGAVHFYPLFGPDQPDPSRNQADDSGAYEIGHFDLHQGAVWDAVFSPDGKTALSASGNSFTDEENEGFPDCGLRQWEVDSMWQVRRLEMENHAATCAAFSPDGRRVLSGASNGTVHVWDLLNGRENSFKLHGGWVSGVAFSPDGERALSGSYDGNLLLWEVQTGTVLKRFEGRPGAVVTHVTLSSDGRRALSGGSDKAVRLWDVETAKEIMHFEAHTKYVGSVALSPDQQYALSAGDSIQLWDLQKRGAVSRRFEGHDKFVWRIVFSPDGRRALSGDAKTVRLWDVATGKEILCFRGHTDNVYSVAFSPDGRTALSASADKTVRLWRLPEGDPVP
jgi:serine/threonine protein kinase